MQRMMVGDWTRGNLLELEEALKAYLRERLRMAAYQHSLPFVSDRESRSRG